MVPYMKVSGKMIRRTVTEDIFILMVTYIKANGEMTKYMAMVLIYIKMVLNM